MLFNSLEFAIFLPIVFLLYWYIFSKSYRWQNVFLLLASCFFYVCWDWKTLPLIVITAFSTWLCGLGIHKARQTGTAKGTHWYQSKAGLISAANIILNLGILCVFKYYNFFAQSFADAFQIFGIHLGYTTLHLILPLGISYYTFRAISYSIDVYRGQMEPTRDFLAFFAFIIFFPLLLTGPIERARTMLGDFLRKRAFDKDLTVDGLRQILWGLFKKIVISGNCALFVDKCFKGNPGGFDASILWTAIVLYAFQLYADFSGCSDIAIGVSKLFGFRLKRNFNYPYFSRNMSEFWRRWHISLMSWFMDYLYIPLGGSRGGKWKTIRNIFIVFLISGLWHGADWTFILWGGLQAVFILPLVLLGTSKRYKNTVAAQGRLLPGGKEFFSILTTFVIFCFGLIPVRSQTVSYALEYFYSMFDLSFFTTPVGLKGNIVVFILIMLVIEWLQREKEHGLSDLKIKNKFLRYALYYALTICVFWFGGTQEAFIYMQF